ncbi:MAG TPA: tripartite tricarboxylate transporter substrate-binding protein [Beijerinckiaceae bacterium]|nr:tripartite tricarboxylate transporter substrate-binding protein [Beijerinckiaceae bacterium]
MTHIGLRFKQRPFRLAAAAAATLCLIAPPALAAPFYKGKVVTLYVGFSAGGGYDLYARTLARYMGRYLPGKPTVVVKNMTGAGGLRLANWTHSVAPDDGTAFSMFARVTPFDPLLGDPGAQFKTDKAFTYVGSANKEVSVCVSWHTSDIKTFKDILTKTFIVGSFGPDTDSEQHVHILNRLLGTKMKLVKGYNGGNDVNLAMQRGEVQGRCGYSWSGIRASHMDWVRNGDIHIIVQNAVEKHPDLPNVPLIMDMAKTARQKQMLRLAFEPEKMGRPFMAPPHILPKRLAELRAAFMRTMTDKDFLAMAKKAKLEISPMSGQAMTRLVRRLYATPRKLALATGALMR